MSLRQLLTKYHNRGSRYGHYPSWRDWKTPLSREHWLESVVEHYNSDEGIDLYLHIPFCESLCTFCGCNIKVTRNHDVEFDYIDCLKFEWEEYLKQFKKKKLLPKVSSIYFGGGTPTFLSASNLENLLEFIVTESELHKDFFGTIEADPRHLSSEKLSVLSRFGFKKIIFGVQDLNQKVMENVNRAQPFELVREKMRQAREYGFTDINFDLIYGLPFQSKESIRETLALVNQLSPDGLSIYPLAHVPWQKAGQSALSIFKPLDEKTKIELQAVIYEHFSQHYLNLGFGHFTKETSLVGRAAIDEGPRRNIMGFCHRRTPQLIGLGVGAISVSEKHLWQNEKIIDKYQFKIKRHQDAGSLSHHQSEAESYLQDLFERIVCLGKFEKPAFSHDELLDELFNDGLLEKDGLYLSVTPIGRFFLKNICQAFDPGYRPERLRSNA